MRKRKIIGITIAGNHMRYASIKVAADVGDTIYEEGTSFANKNGESIPITEEMIEKIKKHLLIRRGMHVFLMVNKYSGNLLCTGFHTRNY
jgi:hypothetical protein